MARDKGGSLLSARRSKQDASTSESNFDAFRTLAALLMCDDDEPYFAQERRCVLRCCSDSENDDIEIFQLQVNVHDRIASIIAKLDSRAPNTVLAKMFLPWMIALHGFSFGGCEHRATASLLIFEILSKEAPKVKVTADDIEFLRENGGNTWNSFVADRHINSGITYIVSFHVNII